MSPTSSIAGCHCDRLNFPPKPRIPAGLSALPRQLAGFPEFRLAMLRQIPAHQLLDAAEIPATLQRPLRDWRAREGSDLGIMLLEMWAYVLDLLAFYEERIAKLVSGEEVQVAAFNKFRQFRDAMINLPDRLAAMLAAESVETTVHALLTTEIRKALNDFADESNG